MNQEKANKLGELTSDFYAEVADSFSQTRQSPWPGWQRSLAELAKLDPKFSAPEQEFAVPEQEFAVPEQEFAAQDPKFSVPELVVRAENSKQHALTIIDLACGNMRFEEWLKPAIAHCFDNCEALIPKGCAFTKMDLLHELPEVTADLCVCFGFMHHVPTQKWRAKILDYMAKSDYAIVTFWQFLNSEKIAAKAEQIGESDYLLGWQDRTDVHRYCHFYTNDEISRLVSPFEVIAEFQEDGANHNLNHYVIFKS